MNTGNRHESRFTEELGSWTKKIEITWEGRQIGWKKMGVTLGLRTWGRCPITRSHFSLLQKVGGHIKMLRGASGS